MITLEENLILFNKGFFEFRFKNFQQYYENYNIICLELKLMNRKLKQKH